jgi:hypothetical protein
MRFSLVVGVALVMGCEGVVGGEVTFDAGAVLDSGALDAAIALDAGVDAGVVDAGVADAGVVDAGAVVVDAGEPTGIFAAVGDHVHHLRSLDDGLTWVDEATDLSQSMMGDLYGVRSVVWGNGQYVAFAAKVFTSPDARTWTEVPKADGQWLACMSYAQGKWVSSGGYGWLATTVSDLGNWTQHPPDPNYTTAHHSRGALAHGVVNGVDAWVVVDDDGVIFHSSDAVTWQSTSGVTPVPSGFTWGTSFAFGNGVFVGLLPAGDAIIRSDDAGATWSRVALSSTVSGMVFAQGHFTLTASGKVFTSTDGASWVEHAAPTARAGDLFYGHGTWLALDNNAIYRSTDEVTWAKVFDNGSNLDGISEIAFGPR